jgi:hypothetical protein
MPSEHTTADLSYDLFLSYNSADHVLVKEIAQRIRQQDLKPFLDSWYFVPGIRWRPKLEQILSSCKAVAVCVGPGEMGRWQQREVDVALDLQAHIPNFPVIPVLLPGCEPPLGFLRQLTWVDLRNRPLDEATVILAKAARGEPPGPELQSASYSIRASVCPYRGLLHFREEDAPFFLDAKPPSTSSPKQFISDRLLQWLVRREAANHRWYGPGLYQGFEAIVTRPGKR